MKYKIKKWDEEKFGEMTFENICRRYSSDKKLTLAEKLPFLRSKTIENKDGKYIIRWNRYESSIDFSGESYGTSDYYILEGKCEIKIAAESIRVQTKEYFKFPKGKYNFRAIGDDSFEYVAAYKLPAEVPISNIK